MYFCHVRCDFTFYPQRMRCLYQSEFLPCHLRLWLTRVVTRWKAGKGGKKVDKILGNLTSWELLLSNKDPIPNFPSTYNINFFSFLKYAANLPRRRQQRKSWDFAVLKKFLLMRRFGSPLLSLTCSLTLFEKIGQIIRWDISCYKLFNW